MYYFATSISRLRCQFPHMKNLLHQSAWSPHHHLLTLTCRELCMHHRWRPHWRCPTNISILLHCAMLSSTKDLCLLPLCIKATDRGPFSWAEMHRFVSVKCWSHLIVVSPIERCAGQVWVTCDSSKPIHFCLSYFSLIRRLETRPDGQPLQLLIQYGNNIHNNWTSSPLWQNLLQSMTFTAHMLNHSTNVSFNQPIN